jgi:hypothetical protein
MNWVTENKILGQMFRSKGQEELRKLYTEHHNLYSLSNAVRTKKARWVGCMRALKKAYELLVMKS